MELGQGIVVAKIIPTGIGIAEIAQHGARHVLRVGTAARGGVVHIDGNGDYKVSVNADTKGFRYRATGDPDKEYKPKGMEYAAVIIEDGETAVPDAVITIKKVKVDGKDVELKKKSFTYTDAGKLRSNIFNEWISDDGLPDDSRCDKGALFNNYDNTFSYTISYIYTF